MTMPKFRQEKRHKYEYYFCNGIGRATIDQVRHSEKNKFIY